MTYYIIADKIYTQIPNLDEVRKLAVWIFESGRYRPNAYTKGGDAVIPIYKTGDGRMHSYVSRMANGKGYDYYWTKKAWNRGTDTTYQIEKNGKRRF